MLSISSWRVKGIRPWVWKLVKEDNLLKMGGLRSNFYQFYPQTGQISRLYLIVVHFLDFLAEKEGTRAPGDLFWIHNITSKILVQL